MNVTEAFASVQTGNTVYGTSEPEAYRVARTYRALRQRGEPATEAWKRAHSLKPLYPSQGGNMGAVDSDGLRWIERPADAGLRFVGFADEVAPRRVEHKGWFTSEFQGETLRGAVYQLPARNGRPLYVAGYQECGMGDGGARLALGEMFTGEPGGAHEWYDEGEDAARDAASRADRIAEIAAEKERDYQAAWQAGSRWQDAGADIATARREALAILQERRGVTLPPAMCAAVRARVSGLLETINNLRAKRGELVAGYWQTDAFNDGAGAAVL